MSNKPLKPALKVISSVQSAIVLIILIIFASIIGTFIPQGLKPAEYIQRYGLQISNLFSILGFTDIYHVWWFILLLSLLSLNLVFCSFNRIKFRKKSVGLIITHLSILLVLSGAIISAVWGVRGVITLYEGEAKGFFADKDKIQDLGFKVRLDKFTLERDTPDYHQITVYIKDKDIKKDFKAKQGINYPIEGANYSFQILRYLPDFYLDQNKLAQTRTEMPNNPAVLVKISGNQEEKSKWLFSNFPAFSHGPADNIELTYKWAGSIKSFKSEITVIDGDKEVLSKTVEVNSPLQYKRYVFYQSSYNPEELNWTGLQVVKDPGVIFVYAGFVLLNIGIILIFYSKQGLKIKPGIGIKEV